MVIRELVGGRNLRLELGTEQRPDKGQSTGLEIRERSSGGEEEGVTAHPPTISFLCSEMGAAEQVFPGCSSSGTVHSTDLVAINRTDRNRSGPVAWLMCTPFLGSRRPVPGRDLSLQALIKVNWGAGWVSDSYNDHQQRGVWKRQIVRDLLRRLGRANPTFLRWLDQRQLWTEELAHWSTQILQHCLRI